EDNFIPDEHSTGMLYESPCTINDTWGYKSFDNNWKSADTIIDLKNTLNSRGINYLLNVGPDALGRIPGPSVKVLEEVGARS
ncbi:MAG: alpha-L-fucosidase, partial [Clostridia bacterium]|nr:alpha-L-fucosidase [Clostridia bacterium]